MESVHLIHPRKYDVKGGTFIRDAFANNRGSLSIIDEECAEQTSGSVCAYIRIHYGRLPGVASNPPVFWRFDTSSLHAPHRLVDATNVRDPCQYVVEGLTDEQLWQSFENVDISNLEICENGTTRKLTLLDIKEILK